MKTGLKNSEKPDQLFDDRTIDIKNKSFYDGGLWVLRCLIEFCGDYSSRPPSAEYWQKKFIDTSHELRRIAAENKVNLSNE